MSIKKTIEEKVRSSVEEAAKKLEKDMFVDTSLRESIITPVPPGGSFTLTVPSFSSGLSDLHDIKDEIVFARYNHDSDEYEITPEAKAIILKILTDENVLVKMAGRAVPYNESISISKSDPTLEEVNSQFLEDLKKI